MCDLEDGQQELSDTCDRRVEVVALAARAQPFLERTPLSHLACAAREGAGEGNWRIDGE